MVPQKAEAFKLLDLEFGLTVHVQDIKNTLNKTGSI